MFSLIFLDNEEVFEVEFKKVSKNVIEITGDFPAKDCGFTLSRTGKDDGWDYSAYTTIYREVEGGIQFSNDGSIYTEPIEPVPTAEELAEIEERKRVATIQNEIADLKSQLEATDYKVIKCMEYSINGLELPYDMQEIHAERQALRDRINELETM